LELKIDCSYFPGDKPCKFHKLEGIKCSGCPHYKPRKKKIYRFFSKGIAKTDNSTSILIIKLGAPGDVIRTTPLLHALRREYKEARIVWVTDRVSRNVLSGNTLVNEVLVYGDKCIKKIINKEFDIMINPENNSRSAFLAERVPALVKLGYGMNERGFIYPYNEEAEYWLEMAGFDDVKKANRKTYQEILFEMCGFKFNPVTDRIILPHIPSPEATKVLREKHGFHGVVVGMHTGAGRRWGLKKWKVEGFVEVAARLLRKGMHILVLGGKLEEKRNQEIYRRIVSKGVQPVMVNTGGSLKQFINYLSVCDLIVCGDTMALHLGLGLGKKVVALFGPTSPWEIEMYGNGVKIVPEMECICCYRESCRKKPNCMDAIGVDMVYEAVIRLL